MSYIYKDYQIIAGWLVKDKINERHHLLWQKQGVPCMEGRVLGQGQRQGQGHKDNDRQETDIQVPVVRL